MKQFAKIALASLVGAMVYDVLSDSIQFVVRKRKKKKDQHVNYKSSYSPGTEGRKTIGFKMKDEE